MRMTINQLEIEEAIRNYVMNQIHVKEDMEIQIKLRATRGEEGYQAEIDIEKVKPASPTPPTKPKPTPAPKAADKPSDTPATLDVAKKVEQAKAKLDPEPVVKSETISEEAPIDEAPVAQVEEQIEEPSNVIELGTANAATNNDGGEAPRSEEPAATAEEPAKPRSIFGNLKSKVNDPS